MTHEGTNTALFLGGKVKFGKLGKRNEPKALKDLELHQIEAYEYVINKKTSHETRIRLDYDPPTDVLEKLIKEGAHERKLFYPKYLTTNDWFRTGSLK